MEQGLTGLISTTLQEIAASCQMLLHFASPLDIFFSTTANCQDKFSLIHTFVLRHTQQCEEDKETH